MAVLKNRTVFLPGEFQLLLPEIGMKKPIHGSFSEVVTAFAKIVQKNPALAQKHGWPTTREAQENWLDEREAHRMIAGGYFGFVELEGSPPAYSGGASRSGPGVVAAAVSGLAVYRELFGGSSVPVPREEAERRAAICAGPVGGKPCPCNSKGGLREWFTESVAKGITELYGMMRDLDLTTSRDKDLGTCTACACPMKAKIWASLDTINKHMKSDVRDNLDPRCWILTEPNPVGKTTA